MSQQSLFDVQSATAYTTEGMSVSGEADRMLTSAREMQCDYVSCDIESDVYPLRPLPWKPTCHREICALRPFPTAVTSAARPPGLREPVIRRNGILCGARRRGGAPIGGRGTLLEGLCG